MSATTFNPVLNQIDEDTRNGGGRNALPVRKWCGRGFRDSPNVVKVNEGVSYWVCSRTPGHEGPHVGTDHAGRIKIMERFVPEGL